MKTWVLAAALCLGMTGCQDLTPEQQAKVDATTAAFDAAVKQVEAVKATVDAYVVEYTVIKTRIDAGEAIPATLVSRYTELAALIGKGAGDVKESVAKVQDAKKALEEAIGAGVKWYNAIPWGSIGAGILCLLTGYFPAAGPAIRAATAVIQGVSAFAAANPAAGQAAKDAILQASRDNGSEGTLDKLVQKVDPPKA
jgi:hypothetical protein